MYGGEELYFELYFELYHELYTACSYQHTNICL